MLAALAALLAAQLLSQYACNSLKARFGRVRPVNWLHRQELNAAFPSGHSATAVVTYGGILLLFSTQTPDPIVRTACIAAAAIFVAGIGWSRIALGAHYVSDVLAGYLVGFATLCMVLAAARAVVPAIR